jgi:hypothetical protein
MTVKTTYETSTTVNDQGLVQIVGVPFAPGTQVEVSISPKRGSAEEFAMAWQRLCAELRSRPGIQGITDDDIQKEIVNRRAGR